MPAIIESRNPNDINQFETAPSLPALDPAVIEKHQADAHYMLVDGRRIIARLSLWYSISPVYGDHRVGVIGHYAASDADSSGQLLQHACTELSTKGCTIAVGPMDGSTMQRYRFIIERGDEPAFLLEPDNPDEWPDYWRSQGFSPISTYYSSINADLTQQDPRVPEVAKRLNESGITIRNIRPYAFEDDLRKIYRISAVSFRNNFMYVPFNEVEYLSLYTPYRDCVDPRMIFIAEHEDKPVGFMFNIPNLLQKQRGETIDTIILKTFAVLPGRAYAGLGSVLVAHSHRAANESGYQRAIHALMYEKNNSLNTSNRFSKPFRRYALFAKEIR